MKPGTPQLTKVLGEMHHGDAEIEITGQERKSTREVIARLSSQYIPEGYNEDGVFGGELQSFAPMMHEKIRELLKEHNVLHYYPPLQSNIPVIGRLVTLVRKIIRRGLAYLFAPLIEAQDGFNRAICDLVGDMSHSVTDLMQCEWDKLRMYQAELDAYAEEIVKK